jgi:RimJ/RimL family protein N-acetyltransferase
MEDASSGKLLGSTGLAFESPWLASTGYVLARESWGKGLASEALSAVVTLAQAHGVRSLYALCHASHAASRRVLEKNSFLIDAAGARRAVFPNFQSDEPQDVCCYRYRSPAPELPPTMETVR